MVTSLTPPELDAQARGRVRPGHGGSRVLLITESSYPYRISGVSTWCRLLVGGLADVDFSVLAITEDPDSQPIFELPPNVRSLTTIPLWGTRESLETRRDLTWRQLRRTRRTVDQAAVTADIAPAFGAFVAALFAEAVDPVELGRHVTTLYRSFLTTDFDTALRAPAVWDAFVAAAQAEFPAAAERAGYRDAPLGLSDATTGMHWVYHWLLPLSRPLPPVEVAHATMAGSCTLAAVALQQHHGARFVFSEHGLYLREAYLREASDRGSLFLKLLKLGFAHRMSKLSYASADQITSCCDYNTRWQSRIGAAPERVTTVYYGLDPDAYGPPSTAPAPSKAPGSAPVVVWMGRIDPIKDLETLLRAAAVVHRTRPDVVFRLYGAAEPGSLWYYERLLALRAELGLEAVVAFAGYTADPPAAYAGADVVALSSVSEGFPYSTLEAMLCAKPVVATSVGGLDEQLGDCGVLVEPRNHAELAAAVLGLVEDPAGARRLGAAARRRAEALFNLEVQNRRVLDLYTATADRARPPVVGDGLGAPAEHPAGVGGELEALVASVADRVPHPVDALEMATVIEASGVNDAVAAARYGAADVFELGDQVLARRRADAGASTLRPHDVAPPWRRPQHLPELVRGLLLLVPAAAVIVLGHLLIKVPGWTSGTGRAFIVGVTSSMVIANAVLFGAVRRCSLLIGCGRWEGARRSLWRVTWVTAVTLLGAEALGLLVAGQTGAFQGSVLTTFALSFSGLAAFWLASAGFVVLDRTYEPGLAVLVGAGVGLLVDHVLAAGSPRHLAIASVAAYVTALGLIAGRSYYLLGQQREGPEAYQRPSRPYVVDEALPYCTYGGLLIVLLLGPTLLTVFAGTSPSTTSADLYTVAVGMTLALLPLMVSLFAADDAMQRFWEAMCAGLSATDLGDAEGFATELSRWHSVRRRRYLAQVALISVLYVPVIWLLADDGAFHSLGVSSNSLLVSAFVMSLVAYLLFGAAQFDAAMTLTLARAPWAVRSLGAGVLAAAIVVAATVALHYPEVGVVGLLVGTAVFAVTAHLSARRFCGDLAFHVASSM